MLSRVVVAGLFVGCYTQPAPTTPLANKTAAPATSFVVRHDRVGPITADTPALLLPLRRALPGYDVRANHRDGLEYTVEQAGELLAYVVPNDHDGTIFNVHVTSPRVSVVGRSWRVGASFRGAANLTACECWGSNPTCFKQGETVAVNFDRDCGDLEGAPAESLSVLEGARIQRIVWSPRPFGSAEAAPDDDVHSYP